MPPLCVCVPRLAQPCLLVLLCRCQVELGLALHDALHLDTLVEEPSGGSGAVPRGAARGVWSPPAPSDELMQVGQLQAAGPHSG